MMQKEKAMKPIAGLPVVLVGLFWWVHLSLVDFPTPAPWTWGRIVGVGNLFGLWTFYGASESGKMIQLFGKYIGTAKSLVFDGRTHFLQS